MLIILFRLTRWYIGLSIFNIAWIIITIVNVEFTITLNHLSNVVGFSNFASAGQFIPAFIGLISLIKVLWEIAHKRIIPLLRAPDKARRKSSTEGQYRRITIDEVDEPQINHHQPESNTLQAHRTFFEGAHPGKTSQSPSPTYLLTRRAPAQRPRKRRSLPHRILLAWLPWLNIFEWSRHTLTPEVIRNSGLFAQVDASGLPEHRKRDSRQGLEASRGMNGVAEHRVKKHHHLRDIFKHSSHARHLSADNAQLHGSTQHTSLSPQRSYTTLQVGRSPEDTELEIMNLPESRRSSTTLREDIDITSNGHAEFGKGKARDYDGDGYGDENEYDG
jgi:hypothetical protein